MERLKEWVAYRTTPPAPSEEVEKAAQKADAVVEYARRRLDRYDRQLDLISGGKHDIK